VYTCCNYLPFEEDLALYLKKFEFSSSMNVLYQVLACWFWRGRFLKVLSVFFTLLLLTLLGEGVNLHLNNSVSYSPKDDLCQLWLELDQQFWRRSQKCKSLTDRQMDRLQSSDGQQTTGNQKSSFELSA
jgi:hypothetical protein